LGHQIKIRIFPIVVCLLFPLIFFVEKKVRDCSGNLAETWTNRGDKIEIRNKDNDLIRERHRVDERIEVRDGYGNLIREESGDSD
jgi:hypothetical protein